MYYDFYIWKENSATKEQFCWEVVRVYENGEEDVVASGIEDSKINAKTRVAAAMAGRH